MASASIATLLLEILSNISAIGASPGGIQWIHDRVVASDEAQARLDAALASQTLEPPPDPGNVSGSGG